MSPEDRMRKVMLEAEGICYTCPKCDTPLEKVDLTRLGMGDNATLPMLHCPDCDQYYTHWVRLGAE